MDAFFILFIFFGIASIMIGLAQCVFQVWAHFSFRKAQNGEINTGVRKRYNLLADNSHVQETFVWRRVFTTWTVICKIFDIFNYSWKRKRTWNFFTNCDWKKMFFNNKIWTEVYINGIYLRNRKRNRFWIVKNSPIRGWGGLSKSPKKSKMSIIELSQLGQDLFDLSDLTSANPLPHPSTHGWGCLHKS